MKIFLYFIKHKTLNLKNKLNSDSRINVYRTKNIEARKVRILDTSRQA